MDSGSTHHLLHSKISFQSYEAMSPEAVQTASGLSRIVGKGIVTLHLRGGLRAEAYHAPNFAQNILSVGLSSLLSTNFNSVFASLSSSLVDSACSFFDKDTNEMVFETKILDGLYPMVLAEPKNGTSLSTFSSTVSARFTRPWPQKTLSSVHAALHWHRRIGHPHSN